MASKKVQTGLGVVIAALAIAAFVKIKSAPQTKEPRDYTVMVTNEAGNSGGSGSVVETSPGESMILTNTHVCVGALKKGGKIRKENGEEHRVTGYYLSDEHDLCIATVAADLKDKLELAPEAPSKYEDATITGHPALMPNILTKGHFSDRAIIKVMTGFRPCKEEDFKNPDTGLYCIFMGGIPVVKTYESVVVSATIMPGSSGSAILNSKGELAAVAFAGSQGLSYAYAVPYEAVRNFLRKELPNKIREGKQRPWEKEDTTSAEEESKKTSDDMFNEMKKACKSGQELDPKIKALCDLEASIL